GRAFARRWPERTGRNVLRRGPWSSMCYMSDIAPKSTTQPSARGRAASSKVYEDIAAEIRRSILSGELASGARLPPEKQFADEFGVGRTRIREALRLCAGGQLIQTEEGSTGGSFVA